jgi:hypothetical protein
MKTFSFSQLLGRLLRAENQSRTAKTVEMFGRFSVIEGPMFLRLGRLVASVLYFPPSAESGPNYFRLVGVLIGGLGMLYVVSGRLNAKGFLFASLLDRPAVPPLMAVLWYFGIVPRAARLGVCRSGLRQLPLDPVDVAFRVSCSGN